MRPLYHLTIPEVFEPGIKEVVGADFDFMDLSETFRKEAKALENSFVAARKAYGAENVDVKILRKAELMMRAASAFEIMHRDPQAFNRLFVEVKKRGKC